VEATTPDSPIETLDVIKQRLDRTLAKYAEKLWSMTLDAIVHEEAEFSGEEFIRYFFERSNELVLDVSKKHGDDSYAVLVALIRWEGALFWGHVGDSRLYLFEEGERIHQTKDHSTGQLAVDEGELLEADLAAHSGKIRRALGLKDHFKPAFGKRVDHQERCIHALLCSDGLWGPLEREKHRIRVQVGVNLLAWLKKQSRLALKLGGREADNLSGILVQFGTSRRKLRLVGWMFLIICLLSGMIAGMIWGILGDRF
ncbi:MAG: hypothetical protein AAF357_18755, partial [Verrucomicrobiota bacterium]